MPNLLQFQIHQVCGSWKLQAQMKNGSIHQKRKE